MKIRLALINSCKFLGGAEFWFLSMARAMEQRGCEVQFVTRDGAVADRALEDGLNLNIIPMRNDLDIFSFSRLYRLFRSFKPHAVIMNNQRDRRLAAPAATMAGVPVRIHRKGSLSLKHNIRERMLYKYAITHVYCNSFAVHKRMQDFGFPEERMAIIRSGVDISKYQEADGSGFRRELGISEDEMLVGCIGRLSSLKGQLDLMEASKFLYDKGDKFKLAFIGAGRWEGDYKTRAQELDLDHRVTFTGHRQDIPQVLAALDLVVQPSLSDAFPLSVLEAMAAGKPIISTRCGGPEELLGEDERGLLVPIQDPAALSDAMEKMLHNPELRAGFGRAAGQWALENLEISRVWDRLAEWLAELTKDSEN